MPTAPKLDLDALVAVPGVPEAVLSAATVAALSPDSPPAPWTLELQGLVWLHRAARDAARHHQRGLRHGPSAGLALGSFIRYSDGPVGPYSEVWGTPSLVVHGRGLAVGVPLMAVDSLASIHGGRSNWALPKSLAHVTWERRHGRPVAAHAAGNDGVAWSVEARVRSVGRRVPLVAGGALIQVDAHGSHRRSVATTRGTGRLVRLDIAVSGPTLPEWLLAGRHLGVLIERGTLTVGPPHEVS